MRDKSYLLNGLKFRLAAGLIGLFCVYPVPADAQQGGVITGRVVTDDGKGAPRVSVSLYPAGSRQRGVTSSNVAQVKTDEDGNFRFTGLNPRIYQVSVSQTREYVLPSMLESGVARQRYYRVGDNITITLSRGGVITGRVTMPGAEPMVGRTVSATMVRDAGGNQVRQSAGRPRITDDRGVYRLYGLAPGVYVVSASAASLLSPPPSATMHVKAYHPSSTADTATEVTVTSGGEVTGVDIVLRDDRGHAVSGTVVGGGNPSSPYIMPSVSLVNVATGFSITRSGSRNAAGSIGFAFDDISDGEYEIVARRGGDSSTEDFASSPRRVTVNGSDITGLELRLAALMSTSGKVVIETSTGLCESKTRFGKEEILLFSRRKEKSSATSSPPFIRSYDVDDDGEFTISSLEAGTYLIESLLPDENWYLRSITIPSATPASGRAATAATAGVSISSGINLRSGKNLTGVTLVVAEGAAGLQGRIVAEKDGSPLPARIRLHLVPSEPAAVNDLLRYAETLTRGDRAFEFKYLAPGKYWLTARAVDDPEPANHLPVAWDDAERAKLRKEAEALKIEVELKPCQRISDQVMRFN